MDINETAYESDEQKDDSNSSYKFSNIVNIIHEGEEPYKIFKLIARSANTLEGVTGSAIFIYNETIQKKIDSVVSIGAAKGLTYDMIMSLSNIHVIDIISLGAVQGALVCIYDEILPETKEDLEMLGHHASVVYERQRMSKNLQHFLDRIQVLNELYMHIAKNKGVKSIVKDLVRECCIRFGSDLSLVYLWDNAKDVLEVQGGYGCSSTLVAPKLSRNVPVINNTISQGGYFLFSPSQETEEMAFFKNLDIKIGICSALEVQGENVGVLIIGFQNEPNLLESDITCFREFTNGASVAILNAINQDKVKNYANHLEDLVAERTKELKIQTEKAEDANKAKSRFLANMSHELRTPLTAIIGYSSVMSDGLYGDMNQKQEDALQSITKSSEHLKSLIDDILNLARIESGKEEPEPQPVPMYDLLLQSIKLLMQTANNKGVKIQELEIDDSLKNLSLLVDQKHSKQIIFNLLSNAVKYTPKNGKVWITAQKTVNSAQISIHDNGVGISSEKLGKLFERFERGEDSYSKSQEGTGIGLNLTQKLIEINGGTIFVESTPGKGSSFTVELPLAPLGNIKKNNVVAKNDYSAQLKGLTALIVDQNKESCDLLTQCLEAAGAQVRTGSSIEDGLKNISKNAPDIILTDLEMNGESGVDLIQSIRSLQGKAGDTPVIVLSACAFKADRDIAAQAGADLFIAKPYHPADVIQQINSLVHNHIMEREKSIKK